MVATLTGVLMVLGVRWDEARCVQLGNDRTDLWTNQLGKFLRGVGEVTLMGLNMGD